MKIGFIDYYLDEWHANKYPAWIKEASNGFCVFFHSLKAFQLSLLLFQPFLPPFHQPSDF